MSNFLVLLKKDLLEISRTQKWIIYILVFLAITVFSVVAARVLPEILNYALGEVDFGGIAFEYEISVADSYAQYIANMGEIAWLLVAIMFSSSLFKEKVTSSYNLLKCNKVSEKTIVLSHFLSKLILITVAYIASIIVFVPLNLIVFKEYTGLRGVVALSYVYLSLVFALTLALFISSFIDKKSKGILFVILIYFGLSLLTIFPKLTMNPFMGLTLANNIIMYPDYKINDYVVNLIFTLISIVGMLVASVYLMKNKINNRKKD